MSVNYINVDEPDLRSMAFRRFAVAEAESLDAAMFPGDNKSIGLAVVCISHFAAVLPGSVIRWTTERVERVTNGELPDQTSMIQVYSIVETDQETMVNVEHAKVLDPNYLGQAILPALSDDHPGRGIAITNAYPIWLNLYLAWQASVFENVRYTALFNSRTVDESTGRPGSIVVHSRDDRLHVGTFIDNFHYSPIGRGLDREKPQSDETFAGLAVGTIGLPNSGKSVLTRALYELTLELPHVFAQEANPDGQGMYFQSLDNSAYYQRVRQKWPFAPELAEKFHQHIKALRQRLNLLWVGLGGHPSAQAKRTLEACTHIVLLIRDSLSESDVKMLEQWRSICAEVCIPIIAVSNATMSQAFLRGGWGELRFFDRRLEASRLDWAAFGQFPKKTPRCKASTFCSET